jgi:hypothetical protein
MRGNWPVCSSLATMSKSSSSATMARNLSRAPLSVHYWFRGPVAQG